MLTRLLCLAIGYMFGCFLTAEVISRLRYHQSIFSVGSKNPGLANVAIEYGIQPALLVLLGDALKVVIPIIIMVLTTHDLSYQLIALYVGLGATLGHNYPVWHRFSGGEGVMTTCSTFVMANPLAGFLSLLVGALSVVVTKFLNISAVILCIIYTIWLCFFSSLESVILGIIFTILSYVANQYFILRMFTPEGKKEDTVDIIGALKRKFSK